MMRAVNGLRHNFAFDFFKKMLQKPNEKSREQVMKEAENLGFLIDKVKQKNALFPKLLPPKTDKKLTIVTQLDETLCYTFTPDENGYLLAPFRKYDYYHQYPEYEAYLSIYMRKGLDVFMKQLLDNYQVVVWTTGVPSYMDILLKYLDPENRIKHKLTQEHCDRIIYEKEEVDQYVKDLNLLDRDLGRVVCLDSHAFGYWMYPSNCIPVEQFRADNTRTNEDLTQYLDEIQMLDSMPDVRPYLEDRYVLQFVLKDSKLL